MFELKNKLEKFLSGRGFPGGAVEINAFGNSEQGLRRGENEDSFLIWRIGGGRDFTASEGAEYLLAAADGLGHDRRGQFASRLAIETLYKVFSFPSHLSPDQRLKKSLEIVNRRIFNLAEHDKSLRGIATTLTAVYIKNTIAYIAHVGNSRAYLIRNGEIIQMTKDQTLAQIIREIGSENQREISKTAYKTLLQAVGNDHSVEVWQTAVELSPDDLLLVCSDGLTAELSDEEIKQIITQNAAQPETAVEILIDRANANGGVDNITAIVADIKPVADRKFPVPAGINDPLIFRVA